MSEKVDRNADGIDALLAIAEIHEREMQAHERQMQARHQSMQDHQMQLQAHEREITNTDERLNALINRVERYISEGRDGKRG